MNVPASELELELELELEGLGAAAVTVPVTPLMEVPSMDAADQILELEEASAATLKPPTSTRAVSDRRIRLFDDIWLYVISLLGHLCDLKNVSMTCKRMYTLVTRLSQPFVLLQSSDANKLIPENSTGILLSSNHSIMHDYLQSVLCNRTFRHWDVVVASKCFRLSGRLLSVFLSKKVSAENLALTDMDFQQTDFTADEPPVPIPSSSGVDPPVYAGDRGDLKALVLSNSVFRSINSLDEIFTKLFANHDGSSFPASQLRWIGLGGSRFQSEVTSNTGNIVETEAATAALLAAEELAESGMSSSEPGKQHTLVVEVTHLSALHRYAIKRMLRAKCPSNYRIILIDLLTTKLPLLRSLLLTQSDDFIACSQSTAAVETRPLLSSPAVVTEATPAATSHALSSFTSAIRAIVAQLPPKAVPQTSSELATQKEMGDTMISSHSQSRSHSPPSPAADEEVDSGGLHYALRPPLVSAANRYLTTPLHVAARAGDLLMVDFLVNEMYARIDLKDAKGHTCVHRASEANRAEALDIMLSKKLAPSEPCSVRSSEYRLMRHLCSFNHQRETPLSIAALYGHHESTKCILSHFPRDLLAQTLEGFVLAQDEITDALNGSALCDRITLVADAIAKYFQEHFEVELGHTMRTRLEYLLSQAFPKPSSSTSSGSKSHSHSFGCTLMDFLNSDSSFMSPLHAAVIQQSVPVVKLLLNHGDQAGVASCEDGGQSFFSPNYPNTYGDTPLHLAFQSRGKISPSNHAKLSSQQEIIDLLVAHGGNPGIEQAVASSRRGTSRRNGAGTGKRDK